VNISRAASPVVTNFAFCAVDLAGTFIRHTGPTMTGVTGRTIDVLQTFDGYTGFVQANCYAFAITVLSAFWLLVNYTNVLDADLAGRAIAV